MELLRQPQRVVRGVHRRQRRNEEIERITQLALARAEENVIRTHVENAIGFVALLEEHLPLDRGVQQYLGAVGWPAAAPRPCSSAPWPSSPTSTCPSEGPAVIPPLRGCAPPLSSRAVVPWPGIGIEW
jgi:hypothetical protein